MEKHLWYIHGQAYDLNDFVDRHPGGKRALVMMRGQDCTEMFEAYHSLFFLAENLGIHLVRELF